MPDEFSCALSGNEAPFTAGPLDAKICFVGEAPGEEEARRGGAFIGQAGDELTRLCANAGINKAFCRLENVFQFHPPGNDLSPYIRFTGKNVFESQQYIEARDALALRLAGTSANVIVPLGNISMWALAHLRSITKQRGSIVESTLMPGRKIIPTIHPSAALRKHEDSREGEGNWLYRYFIAYDLRRIKKESEYLRFGII